MCVLHARTQAGKLLFLRKFGPANKPPAILLELRPQGMQPGQQAGVPLPGGDWREAVTTDIRRRVIQKLCALLFDKLYKNTYAQIRLTALKECVVADNDLSSLTNLAIQIENSVYKQAKSHQDYFKLTAEKIYTLQRKKQQQQQQQQVGQQQPQPPQQRTMVQAQAGQMSQQQLQQQQLQQQQMAAQQMAQLQMAQQQQQLAQQQQMVQQQQLAQQQLAQQQQQMVQQGAQMVQNPNMAHCKFSIFCIFISKLTYGSGWS